MKSIVIEREKQLRSFDDTDALEALGRLFPHQSVQQLNRLEAGLSNINFYAELGSKPYLLKVFNGELPETALTIQNKLAVQGITQAVICIDKTEKLAVLEYLTTVDVPPAIDKKLLEVLVKIHHYPSQCHHVLDLAAEVRKAAKQLHAVKIGDYLISEIKHLTADIRYCHNDLVRENVLNTPSGICFIDFEYAGKNDLFFDLAALCCSFELSSLQSYHMLVDYFQIQSSQLPSYAMKKLTLYVGVYLILSIAWYESRGECKARQSLLAQFLAWCQHHNVALPRKV
ncbi:phosphotransferase [Pseudoalteromonas luteoviolacea]|uniref:phosphotransferase n=1 Tax=Pseudoalteromonas luteoviolacea TaxID=43657 RepID=UPI0009B90D1B|nr:phosphotransferase [Pseudoalteromonas luteoviolacea]